MSDLNHHEIPPGGWRFRQPQTAWQAPTPISSTFDQTVVLIIKHRLANPAITAKHKLATSAAAVGDELDRFTRLRLGIPLEPNVPKTLPPGLAPQSPGVVAGLRKVAAGAATLIDWLASGGKAVAPELSAKRAEVCATCPKNGSGDLTSWFTVPVAAMIQKELDRRTDLKLSTPYDDKLGVCEACLCPMRLKVHTPLDSILKHLKPDARAELDPRCWILKQDA